MYPLLLTPIYKERVWGGNRLQGLPGRNACVKSADGTAIGESWDVSCRTDEMCIVENGPLKGKSFRAALNENPEAYLGKSLCCGEGFPLLVKLIDAREDLSVQVHPDDSFAARNEREPIGKTELWYVLEPPQDGYLLIGLKDGVTKDIFEKSIIDKRVMNAVNKLPVKKGDVISIPAGLVHAIKRGAMILEIQQNSDITYRVFDYSRKDQTGKERDLHIRQSLEVSDFDNKLKKSAVPGLRTLSGDNASVFYAANKYFSVIQRNIKSRLDMQTDGDKFIILTSVGDAEIVWSGGRLGLPYGRSIFIPAALGSFSIEGCSNVIQSFVPDIRRDFIEPLLNAGYTMEDIKTNTDVWEG